MVSAPTSSEEDVNSLQGVAEGYMVQCKDAARAALCRERGNSSFQIRDYTAATLHYSQVNRYWDELQLHTQMLQDSHSYNFIANVVLPFN